MSKPAKRMLLVDYDDEVASALLFACYRSNPDCDVSVARTADDALQRLNQAAFDAIIANADGSGTDGVELLRTVKVRHPKVARIIIAERPDEDLMLKSLGIVHQYLAKPCSLRELMATVTRLGVLDHFFNKEPLRRVATEIQNLPSPPTISLRLTKELARSDATTDSVGAIIEQDANLTAKILQLANSAFFNLERPVVKVSEAVQVLGFNLAKSLALSLGVSASLASTPRAELNPDDLYRHSLCTGLIAQKIADDQGADQATTDAAFTAGILHDTGKLVFASALPELYAQAARLAADESLAQWQAEVRVFGAGHGEIGAFLLGLWGLPYPIVEAVAWHHEPRRHEPQAFDVLTAVHVADYLANQRVPSSHRHLTVKVDEAYIQSLGLTRQMDEWADVGASLA